jgi:2-oxoisovalerate dehydrogenase E1 component alpha subunit
MSRSRKKAIVSAQPFKDKEFSVDFYRHMVRNRVLEERLIKMVRTGDGYFWIGGPGEEAFNVALALQIQKGEGPEFDFLHLHYRNNGVLLTLGSPMVDFVRQMRSSAHDPFSGGRNFVAHVAKKEWNIPPVTSPIGTQFAVAPGTAWVQRARRLKGEDFGISVVVGGDAGTAEGEFASSLIWSSRPGLEVPLLMIVTNNQFGISTAMETQFALKHISDRGRPFGIETASQDGNQPEKVWAALHNALDYVRSTGRPYLLELKVSRLHGHSSSSGANRNEDMCPVDTFGKKLLKQGWLDDRKLQAIWDEANAEFSEAIEQVRSELQPDPSTIHLHTFAGTSEGGIPGRDF